MIQALHTVKQIETSFHEMHSFAKSDIVIYWKGLCYYCMTNQLLPVPERTVPEYSFL